MNFKNISQPFIKNQYMQIKILRNSIKFYLPRLEGYSEIIRTIADEYGNMSLMLIWDNMEIIMILTSRLPFNSS